MVPKLPPLYPGRVGPEAMFTPASEIMTNPAGTLDELKTLGVDVVHVYMHWADIAPDPTSSTKPVFDATDPAAYPAAGWAPYDTIVRDAARPAASALISTWSRRRPIWATGDGRTRAQAPQPRVAARRPPSSASSSTRSATRYSGHYTPAGSRARSRGSTSGRSGTSRTYGPSSRPRRSTTAERRGRAAALPRASRTPPGTRCTRPGTAHDTILIGELAPTGEFQRAPGFRRDGAAAVPARAVLRGLRRASRCAAPPAAARGCPATARGSAALRRRQTRRCSMPPGSPIIRTPTDLPPDVPSPAARTTPTSRRCPAPRVDARPAAAARTARHALSDLVDRVRLHDQPAQ